MAKHVMLDLETLSTRKNAAVVQIAAIAFDPLTGLVDGTPEARPLFNVFVREQAGHVHIDPSTVAWWLQQAVAPSLGKKIETTGVYLGEALSQFCAWFKALGPVDAVWSHGATFDIPIVETHCQALSLAVPWSYREPRDTRTLYALAPGGMPCPPKDETREHDAQYDCEYQIAQVCEAYAKLRAQAAEVERWKEEFRITEEARASFEDAFRKADAHAENLERALGQGPRGPRGKFGEVLFESALAPLRGRADETHDDPPVEGGYRGGTSQNPGDAGTTQNPTQAVE